MAKCLHKNIKIVTNSYYKIPKGWKWLNELYDIDMTDYFIKQELGKTVCKDCNKVLD